MSRRAATTLVLAGLAAARLLRRASGRHVLALGLAALLSVTTVEVALHSVHHLDEPDAGASCPVLAATAELACTAPRRPAWTSACPGTRPSASSAFASPSSCPCLPSASAKDALRPSRAPPDRSSGLAR